MKLPNSRKLKYPFRNYFTPLWKKNILMTKNGVSPNSEIGGNFTKLKFKNESQNSGFQELSNILDSNIFYLLQIHI